MTFSYDSNLSPEDNFVFWYSQNCEERDSYNEPRLSSEDAIAVFSAMYGVSVDPKNFKQFV